MTGKRRTLEFGLSSDPRTPPPWTAEIAYAVRALYEGKANDGQQKLAMRWIESVCALGDLEFRPDDRLSAFAGGKRFVGLQIRKLATLHPQIIEARAKLDKQEGD